MFRITLSSRKLGRTVACALVAASIAAPVAAAEQGFLSPDAQDADRVAQAQGYQDMRSPDARDAGRDAGRDAEARSYQDLRSPDAVDAAAGDRPTVTAPALASDTSEVGGFDWSTAGISAATLAGLLLVAVAGVGSTRLARGRMVRS